MISSPRGHLWRATAKLNLLKSFWGAIAPKETLGELKPKMKPQNEAKGKLKPKHSGSYSPKANSFTKGVEP